MPMNNCDGSKSKEEHDQDEESSNTTEDVCPKCCDSLEASAEVHTDRVLTAPSKKEASTGGCSDLVSGDASNERKCPLSSNTAGGFSDSSSSSNHHNLALKEERERDKLLMAVLEEADRKRSLGAPEIDLYADQYQTNCRKRAREKERRQNISVAIEKLSQLLLKIDPTNLVCHKNQIYFGEESIHAVSKRRCNGGSSLSNQQNQPLNRTEIINFATHSLAKLSGDVDVLKKQLHQLQHMVGAVAAGAPSWWDAGGQARCVTRGLMMNQNLGETAHAAHMVAKNQHVAPAVTTINAVTPVAMAPHADTAAVTSSTSSVQPQGVMIGANSTLCSNAQQLQQVPVAYYVVPQQQQLPQEASYQTIILHPQAAALGGSTTQMIAVPSAPSGTAPISIATVPVLSSAAMPASTQQFWSPAQCNLSQQVQYSHYQHNVQPSAALLQQDQQRGEYSVVQEASVSFVNTIISPSTSSAKEKDRKQL